MLNLLHSEITTVARSRTEHGQSSAYGLLSITGDYKF